jgi:phosphoenolpyruvate synthase/pyruvate phosphate dikinase
VGLTVRRAGVLASRAEQHLSEEPAIAVIIQKMIFSEVSGGRFIVAITGPAISPRHRLHGFRGQS